MDSWLCMQNYLRNYLYEWPDMWLSKTLVRTTWAFPSNWGLYHFLRIHVEKKFSASLLALVNAHWSHILFLLRVLTMCSALTSTSSLHIPSCLYYVPHFLLFTHPLKISTSAFTSASSFALLYLPHNKSAGDEFCLWPPSRSFNSTDC